MEIFCLCFQCPGKFSELLTGDLETGKVIVEGLISQSLKNLSSLMIVDKVELYFSSEQSVYTIEIRIWKYNHFTDSVYEAEKFESQIESLISHALLQLFWAVFVDNPDC